MFLNAFARFDEKVDASILFIIYYLREYLHSIEKYLIIGVENIEFIHRIVTIFAFVFFYVSRISSNKC